MSDPSDALQAAQFTALQADATLLALLAQGKQGVRDYIPADLQEQQFPYVQIGESQVLVDDTEDCGDGSEVFTRTHVWSRAIGLPEVKTIAAEVRRILKVTPTLTGFTVSVSQFVQTQIVRDPDGQTNHAIVEHRYLITHTS